MFYLIMQNLRAVLAMLVVGALVVGSLYIDRTYIRSDKAHSVPPDTIERVERVPKIVRDTVVKEVPRIVERYDTIRVMDTVRIAKPTDLNVRGLLAENYIDIDGRYVSVTYFAPSQHRFFTDTYRVSPPMNTFAFFVEAGVSPLYFGPVLRYERPRFTVDVGYVGLPTENNFQHGIHFSVGYKIGELSASDIPLLGF